ncbi:mechanosensitive ion channel family protein [Flagellimonas sp. S174]|uniref:mechanosensitive ion channel family protein n=1 Tax=Flagellimonas sp. S174 TaxID=3410790 RepID=UPI003BF48FE4
MENAMNTIWEKLSSWGSTLVENIPNLIVAFLVLLLAFLVARYVNRWVKRVLRKRVPQPSIANLSGKIAAVIVVAAGLFLALGALNLSKTLNTLLAGAGISGLVIGLALQGSLTNLWAGIQIAFRKYIQVGNWIETNGYSGEVKDINLNNLVLREFDNNLVIIPNKMVADQPFKNYSLTSRMRVAVDCGVGYDSDLEKVEKIVNNAINELFPQRDDSSVELFYTGFGDSAITFTCRYWVEGENAKNKLDAVSQGLKAIKTALDQNEIDIPFPIRTLEFANQPEITKVLREQVVNQN